MLERFEPPASSTEIMFDEATRPYSRTYAEPMAKVLKKTNAHFWVDALFCPVPMELDEMYPLSQSVITRTLEPGIVLEKENMLEHFAGAGKFPSPLRRWKGQETLDELPNDQPQYMNMNIRRVKAVADMQFGKGAGNALLDGDTELILSDKTLRIRNVRLNGEHILSMRAGDGLFTLKIAGGRILHSFFPSPKKRVIVNPDSAEFNRKGKSVFAAFVVNADPEIIPGDEVLIVDESDNLCAIGRSNMIRDEMLAFSKGIAVSVREGMGNVNDSQVRAPQP